MEVCVSGCVFSSLVYELENSLGDVEGLLLGEINSRIVNTVTDSQSENLRHERVATIQGFVPFGKVHRFYTGVGQIVDDTVSEELNNDNGKTVQKVIGWFKFRRNTQSLVSMRERFIHHNLVEKFSITPSKEFIMAVFTASMNRDMSTHKFDYSFCCSSHRGGPFEPVPVQILNLGDTSHSEYRLNSLSSQATSSLFYEVVDSYRNDFVDDKGCLHQSSNMHGMYITMMKKLQELVELVKMSETSVSLLTEEVESRKKEVEKCRLQLASKNESCEIDNKRPAMHPHSVPTQSNKDVEKECKTVSKEESGISVENNGNEDLIWFNDTDTMQTNSQSVLDKTTNTQMKETSHVDARNLSRRKQKAPVKVVSLATMDEDDDLTDDDLTDDETQTYSFDVNVQGNGPNYEETFSKNLAMESSSPVF